MESMNIDMDVDPIDGGPKPTAPPLPVQTSMILAESNLSPEEQARQAIEMLQSDDVSARVAAANRLDTIAQALGPERTRDELLPFVTDGVDDEDEVLYAMATSLGRMVEHVGGPEHAHVLLPPLELLLTVEESTVRQAAVESSQQVSESLVVSQHYAPMVARLAVKEWFTARISAAALIAHVYPKLDKDDNENHQELLQLFGRLCHDETPMVRRVTAQYLGTMVENVVHVSGRSALEPEGTICQDLLPLYQEFSSNDQPDSVRLQTTMNCVAFGKVLSSLDPPLHEWEVALLKRLLPLVVATIDDRSWRVRWTAAAKFADVVQAYDALEDAMDALVPAYEKLLQDPEAEVRTAATFNLHIVAQCRARVPQTPNRPPQDGDDGMVISEPQQQQQDDSEQTRVSVAERLVKRVTSLTEDDSEHVRAALAMVATELAPILGKDATITHLVPPVLLLLRDAASEVRLNLISSLSALNEVIGVDLLSQSLLPAILDLAQDGKWRIRLAIIEHIPLLAKQLGREFFTDKLASLCVGWLGDDIATIRQAAAANLKELTELFGAEWAIEYLIPSILEIRQHESYLRRLTALQACSMMASVMDEDTARVEVLPLVLEMATDVVPNIRFNVAKELQTMTPTCGLSAYESQVHPVLSMLMEDDDRDVRFYAEKSASGLDQHFSSMATT